MNTITSLYIPCIQDTFNSEFIVNLFEKSGIAQVSRVAMEPIKKSVSNESFEKYNRVYIGIKVWNDTEAAFNLIKRLRNPSVEARIVYCDDNWWPVYINKYPAKLASGKRVLTLFEEKHNDNYNDDLRTTVVHEYHEPKKNNIIKIDVDKTLLLRNIINGIRTTPVYDDELEELDKSKLIRNIMREMDEETMWHTECVV